MKIALALVLLGACDRAPAPAPQPEQARPPRVIEPPPGVVRALPPHAIRTGSVGPYKLGERLSEILDKLPSGPRIVLFEAPGLVHASLIRADDNAVLIGGEQGGTASWVAVVGGPEVARTESGVHVGSTRAEVVAALGAPVDQLDRARDPRMIAPANPSGARLIIDDGRVSAIAIVPEPSAPPTPAAPAPTECPRPPSTGRAIGACLTGSGELVEVGDGGEVTVRMPEAEKVFAAFRVPNAMYAVPLRAADGKDELIIISRADETGVRSWSLVVYRLDGKLTRSEPRPLFEVTNASARLIGAEAKDVDLYLELTGKADSIEVGGLLTTRPAGAPVRDVAVISPISVERRRGCAVDAGAGSGSAATSGAGSGSAGSAATGGSAATAGSAAAGSDRAKP